MGIEQIIIVIVVLVISFLNWAFGEGGLRDLLKKPGDQVPPRSQAPGPRRPDFDSRRSSGESDQDEEERERMRRFFEALGVPPSEMPDTIRREEPPPPPPAPPQPSRPPVPVRPVAREVATSAAATISSAQAYVRRDPASTLSKAEREALERLKSGRSGFPEAAPAPAAGARRPTTKWHQLLQGSEALRQAVVVREVLGPPKALQHDQGIPSLSR